MSSVLFLGLDIGSISINTVLIDQGRAVVENHYHYCHGRPFHLLKDILTDIYTRYTQNDILAIALTGTGGALARDLIGGQFVNEIIAQSEAVGNLYPEVKTVIEMGGEDSKLILMHSEGGQEVSRLSDFTLNNLCAAGTGSFLDQQANRLGLSIENEFGQMALQSENPPRIAGRCSVFAKTDMIHLQQIATPVYDIVAGLCFAVARNFISSHGKGKKLEVPILFQGGVAANYGVVRAFKELLHTKEGEFIIPDHYASMGAIGAVFHLMNKTSTEIVPYKGIQQLDEYLKGDQSGGGRQEPLKEAETVYDKKAYPIPASVDKLEVSLGLDVGSLSTNVVLIDKENHVIARRYLPTAGKPLEAIRRGMSEIFEEVGDRVKVIAAGTTGSGRYLTGDFIGADAIRNEITAQATAAIDFDRKVDTIFEIGGQDSKYISIDDGFVVDFEMNKVCAAGTGSFLEEQAEKLKINIKEEFGNLALKAKRPAALGTRCTVFMESDLNSHQQKGVEKDNLVGGLAYSIVENYIQKVVRKKRIGDHIFFQGGVTNNKAVVAAFEKVTGKKIIVPPHFDVTGAIGVAILSRDSVKDGQKTRFKGFDISKVPYTIDSFVCNGCSNHCEIRRVRIEGEGRPLFFGGRCEKWDLDERKRKGGDLPDLFKERIGFLLDGFKEEPKNGRITIGIPRGLMIFYQQFPFWKTFFQELGFHVVLSDESDNDMIKTALGMVVAETCFPVELMHGHIRNLFYKKADYVFAPFVINAEAEKDNTTMNYNCPWIQTFSFMVKAALGRKEEEERMLIPALNFKYFGRVLNKELTDFMKGKFNIPGKNVIRAIKKAERAQKKFEERVVLRGQEILGNLPEDKEAIVILGRPYNTSDPALNLGIIEKLINQDVLPVPIDYLPLGSEHILQDYPQMYWNNGQKVLAAARIVAREKDLHAIYVTNFRCGPDSFLSHFVQEEMRGKPYLEVEIDEHGADAGMITRYEAFLDSLRGSRLARKRKQKPIMPGIMSSTPIKDRVLYFPYMNDSSYVAAAAVRSCGLDSESLPMQDKESMELGRKYTSGRECFPMICTTGSFLKKLFEPHVNPEKVSFFMPDHNGPCRFGQYNKFQRIVFDRLGFNKAEIISPSNDTSYEDISGGHGTKFRFTAWKGFVAVDLLRKLKQERKPYELIKGITEKIYNESLDAVIRSVENGAKDLSDVLHRAAERFNVIATKDGERHPVIVVVGEIFMRDNPFCSGFIIDRLEKFGAETFVAPFSEWLSYSTYRYTRDSLWKRDVGGLIKSKIQDISQNISSGKLYKAVHGFIDDVRDITVKDMLKNCGPYIHRHYDGDPALNYGSAVALAKTGISGIVNILPLTCAPGTVVASISHRFKRDNNNLPYENIAYDGQEDASIELRLQAFMHQAREYAKINGYNQPGAWHLYPETTFNS
ncbi:MAG: CoA activase [Chlorobi bacterium]|nr:CoA activase [Chlorobiota bacterium]